MLMHPTVPSLDDKIMDLPKYNCASSIQYGLDENIIKTDGKTNLFVAFADVADKSGFGYVGYSWPKPLSGQAVTKELYEKLSFVKKFEPWGWILGSGIYIDDVESEFYANIQKAAIFAFCIFASLIFFAYIIAKDVNRKLALFQSGFFDLFSFLNHEIKEVKPIVIEGKDEFGLMAEVANEYIQKIESIAIKDGAVIEEARNVVNLVDAGRYDIKIESSTPNIALEELKTTINDMLSKANERFSEIVDVLETYAKLDYTKTLSIRDTDEYGGIFERLSSGVNELRKTINETLKNSLELGLELQEGASSLREYIDSLESGANFQAADIEKTSANMEEMLSNIQSNTEKSKEMTNIAEKTRSSVKKGASLINDASIAIEGIVESSEKINEAVKTIHNIAFQTNILSLNAAVEAATAGDAGKGFAVVAQEVRNLANKAAQAAKEIETAAKESEQRAARGKEIISCALGSFHEIDAKVDQTTLLVRDVAKANEEQSQGAAMVNDSISRFDGMIQENVNFVKECGAIAARVSELSLKSVQEAMLKKFL